MSLEFNYRLTPEIANLLTTIESLRKQVADLPVPARLIPVVRESSRSLSTHYSTRIEGNRLTKGEVGRVIGGEAIEIGGREKDVRQVQQYQHALEHAESIAVLERPVLEDDIRILHRMALDGRSQQSTYRNGPKILRDAATGRVIYAPPDAREVPGLMTDLVGWMNEQMETGHLPVPLIAALVHYQFATILPYYDCNGPTVRLLTTLVLHRCGHGFKKAVYALEEVQARSPDDYEEALTIGETNQYQLGRARADVTKFIAYFCESLVASLQEVRKELEANARKALEAADQSAKPLDRAALMRELRPIQRQTLGLFAENKIITSGQLADYLAIPTRQSRDLCVKWAGQGFLAIADPSKKARSYQLAEVYENEVVVVG